MFTLCNHSSLTDFVRAYLRPLTMLLAELDVNGY